MKLDQDALTVAADLYASQAGDVNEVAFATAVQTYLEGVTDKQADAEATYHGKNLCGRCDGHGTVSRGLFQCPQCEGAGIV